MWPAQMNVLKTVALFGLYEWLDIVPTWIYPEPVVDRVTEVFYLSTRHIHICQQFGNIYDVVLINRHPTSSGSRGRRRVRVGPRQLC